MPEIIEMVKLFMNIINAMGAKLKKKLPVELCSKDSLMQAYI